MRILHTGDWHIGQSFFTYDRAYEHMLFFEWLKGVIGRRSIDVMLISGDVFDTQNPSAESQRVYYRFLRELNVMYPELQVIITAGNHDSAARLESVNPLLEHMNISVRGVVKRDADGDIDLDSMIVPLGRVNVSLGGDASIEVGDVAEGKGDGCLEGVCLAVPYLRQGDYPCGESYMEGVKKLYGMLVDRVRDRGLEGPIVAMGHMYVYGGALNDDDRSERIIVGGLEGASEDTFDCGIAYTALGHLHRGQRVSGRDRVCYSGSPLPMSFAEKNNSQGVNIVEIGAGVVGDWVVDVEREEFVAPVRLMSVPGEAKVLEEVLEELGALPEGDVDEKSAYLEVKVLLDCPRPSMKYDIEKVLEGKKVRLAKVSVRSNVGDVGERVKVMSYDDLQRMSPLDIAEDVYRKRYNGEMEEELKGMLELVINEC